MERLKPAENIFEFVDIIDVNTKILPDLNPEMYVDLFDKTLEKSKYSLLYDRNKFTWFMVGQSGIGKTTALRFMANSPEIKEKYEVLHLEMHHLIDEQDANIIDFLVMLGYALCQEAKNKYNSESLIFKYGNELLNIVLTDRQQREIISEETNNQSIAWDVNFIKVFKLPFSEFFPSLKRQSELRSLVRDKFGISKKRLLETVNSILADFTQIAVPKEKNLLLIIDGTDRIRDQAGIKSIFEESRDDINFGLSCKKIILIPPHIYTQQFAYYGNTHDKAALFRIKLTPNPKDKQHSETENEEIEQTKEKLRQVVKKRIANGIDLIDDDAIELAIDYSGSQMRQFLNILNDAAAAARIKIGKNLAKKITIQDVQEGLKEQIVHTSMAISSSPKRVQTLAYILKNYQPPQDEAYYQTFIELLLSDFVMMMSNGESWYEVNPLVKKTVEVHATSI